MQVDSRRERINMVTEVVITSWLYMEEGLWVLGVQVSGVQYI